MGAPAKDGATDELGEDEAIVIRPDDCLKDEIAAVRQAEAASQLSADALALVAHKSSPSGNFRRNAHGWAKRAGVMATVVRPGI